MLFVGSYSEQEIIVEGTRGPFYTIGRLSFLSADTLTTQRNKTWFPKHSTVSALWYRTAPMCLIPENLHIYQGVTG